MAAFSSRFCSVRSSNAAIKGDGGAGGRGDWLADGDGGGGKGSGGEGGGSVPTEEQGIHTKGMHTAMRT